jgi:hypothetical protein
MAERSQFWTTGTTGDGATTITEAQTIEFFRKLFVTDQHATEGILAGVDNELAVTGSASPVAVATGAAITYGFFYQNDASLNVTIPTPAGATRIDRIVLRVSHGTTRTVRVTRIAGTEGSGSAPAITQSAGTTWDIKLAQASITTGGVITLTDERSFAHFATRVNTAMFDANAVDNAALRDSAALSVMGRASNSSGDPADIAAASDGEVLRRSGTALGFGQVATAGLADSAVTNAKIANDAVDDTKVGNRVPQFYRRQGGSASVWSTSGTTTQTPGAVRMQGGVADSGALSGDTFGSFTITFPVAFSAAPLLYLTAQQGHVSVSVSAVSSTGATLTWRAHDGVSRFSMEIAWLAIGPE